MRPTVFPQPQWKLISDPLGARCYANVDNRLEVATEAGTYHVPIVVPTGLFTLMRDVFKIDPQDTVNLALDEVTDGEDTKYVLSLMVHDRLYDLWAYSYAGVPKWVFTR